MELRLSELEVERTGKGGREKRSAAVKGGKRERERQTIHGCQQPKDSYVNWAEMKMRSSYLYSDWRE